MEWKNHPRGEVKHAKVEGFKKRHSLSIFCRARSTGMMCVSYFLMTRPVPQIHMYSIHFYSILFDSILFDSILFYSVLFCSILFCSVLFCSVLFCSVLFCSIYLSIYLWK